MSILPRRAELYRRQVEMDLEGDARAALKARVFLREFLGRIELKREGAELWAEYGFEPPRGLNRPGCPARR